MKKLQKKPVTLQSVYPLRVFSKGFTLNSYLTRLRNRNRLHKLKENKFIKKSKNYAKLGNRTKYPIWIIG